jgi:hypothetical protein
MIAILRDNEVITMQGNYISIEDAKVQINALFAQDEYKKGDEGMVFVYNESIEFNPEEAICKIVK